MRPDLRIVFMTGHGPEQLGAGGPDLRTPPCLHKPFRMAALVETIQRSLADLDRAGG